MSRRLQLMLPEPSSAKLDELARQADLHPARMATQLLAGAIARAARTSNGAAACEPVLLSNARPSSSDSERPLWLEPYGGDRHWRARMWASICVLRERFPRSLDVLQEGWWEDEAHLITLSAFAVWREQLDEGGADPREEIVFQTALADYAAALRRQGGGVSGAWEPGAPPSGWCD